jgi:hypothetical protein
MQIKFEAKELKKAHKYINRLTNVEKILKEERRKRKPFLRSLFQFLFK